MRDELDYETIQEYERLSFDSWNAINTFTKEIEDTIEVIKKQSGALGSKTQQNNIKANLEELQELVYNLKINRKIAPVAYDWEGLQVLKNFIKKAENLLNKYPQFLNDKLGIRGILENVVHEINEYLVLIKDDNYFRRQIGSDYLPNKIILDSSGKLEELSKEEKENLVLFSALEDLKKEKLSTHALSRDDLDTTALKIIQAHKDRKKRVEYYWKLLKEGNND